MNDKKDIPTSIGGKLFSLGRYLVGGFLCYLGSKALFEGVAYNGMFIRGEGLPARLVGIGAIIVGVLLIFNKWKFKNDEGDDGRSPRNYE